MSEWWRPNLLALNPLWITNNLLIIVINFHQDFATSTHSDFFPVDTDRGLFHWLNHSSET
jgi:hypothetical protein